jgi:hypothetical protein
LSDILKRLREECTDYVAKNFGAARARDERAWKDAIQHVLGSNSLGGAPATVHDMTDDQVERVVEAFNELTILAAGAVEEPAESSPTAEPAEPGPAGPPTAPLDEDTYTWLRLPPASYQDLSQEQALDQFVAEAHRIVTYWLLNAPGGPRNPADEDGAPG